MTTTTPLLSEQEIDAIRRDYGGGDHSMLQIEQLCAQAKLANSRANDSAAPSGGQPSTRTHSQECQAVEHLGAALTVGHVITARQLLKDLLVKHPYESRTMSCRCILIDKHAPYPKQWDGRNVCELEGWAEHVTELFFPAALNPAAAISAVYTLDGKHYCICDCPANTPHCPRGRERQCPSAGYDHCMIPVDGVFIVGEKR